MLYKSKAGEVKSLEDWHKEINVFWDWVELVNKRYFTGGERRYAFPKPADAFERYAKIIGLEPVCSSYDGVF